MRKEIRVNIKRITALVLAAAVTLSMRVPAFAENGQGDNGDKTVYDNLVEPETTQTQATEPDAAAEQDGEKAPVAEPEATQTPATEPDAAPASVAEPETTQTQATEPDAAPAPVAEPETTQTQAAEQDAAPASVAEPETTQTQAAEQDATQTQAAEQDATQTQAAEQDATQTPMMARMLSAAPVLLSAEGSEPSSPGADHNFEYRLEYDGTHYQKCMDKDCDYETDKELHTFDENGICSVCQFTVRDADFTADSAHWKLGRYLYQKYPELAELDGENGGAKNQCIQLFELQKSNITHLEIGG